MEYMDIAISNMKHEILNQFEEERSRKNFRLQEITNLIEHHKELTNEHINQLGESLKALLKAKISSEQAELRHDMEETTASLNKRIDALESETTSKVKL